MSDPETPACLKDHDKKYRVFDEQRYVTGKIGETCRYISFGLLALFYSIQNGDSGFSQSLRDGHPYLLDVMAFFAMIAILFDYLQYLSGNFEVKKAIENNYKYNDEWISYKLRSFFYTYKQWLALASAIVFIVVMALTVFCNAA